VSVNDAVIYDAARRTNYIAIQAEEALPSEIYSLYKLQYVAVKYWQLEKWPKT